MSSYLIKRKLALRPVLDKKKDIEQATVEVKQKQEYEQAKLDEISTSLQAAGLELDEINKILAEITGGCEQLSEEVMAYIQRAMQSLISADETLNGFLIAISKLDERIEVQKKELANIETRKATALKEISAAESKLSKREKDLDIYKSRLDKKVKELGLTIHIKL